MKRNQKIKDKIIYFLKPTIWKITSTFVLAIFLYGLMALGFILAWANPLHPWYLRFLLDLYGSWFFSAEFLTSIVPEYIAGIILISGWVLILYTLVCLIIFLVHKFKSKK